MTAPRALVQRPTVRRAFAGLAVVAALATSACAAGQQAETSQELPTLDGTNANVGHLALRGLAVITPDAANYPAGSNPQLRLVIVNNGSATDQLTAISSSVAGGWGSFRSGKAYSAATTSPTPSAAPSSTAAATPTGTTTSPAGSAGSSAASSPSAAATSAAAAPASDGPITLSPGVAESFGVPAAAGRVLALLSTKSVLYPGNSISITFTFAKAGTKTVQVPVELTSDGSYTPQPSYFPSGVKGNEEGS